MNIGYKVGELIYDANIYDGLNTFLSDLQFYKKWLPKNKEAEILELCCGTGRLTIPIAKDGYSICGVDYTPSMLEQAKMKAIEAELVIDFIEADIRMLDLQEKFDLIFIPFGNYILLYTITKIIKGHITMYPFIIQSFFSFFFPFPSFLTLQEGFFLKRGSRGSVFGL